MLIVCPAAPRAMTEERIDIGIEIAMMSVLRQLPRKSSIMAAVSAVARTTSRMTPFHRSLHEDGLISECRTDVEFPWQCLDRTGRTWPSVITGNRHRWLRPYRP